MSSGNAVAHVINVPQYLCLSDLLAVQAERNPDAWALLAPGRTPLSYSRLHAHITEVVQMLHATGLGRQDPIALVLPNGPEMAVAALAVAASATCAPLNPAYSATEFDLYLTGLGAKALIVQAEMDSPARAVARARGLHVLELSLVHEAEAGLFTLTGGGARHVAPLEVALPEDAAVVLHTSGSTSRPKMVPLTHTNICTAAHNLRVAFALVESDRCLNVMPLFHLHGLMTSILAPLVAGASVVCTPGFYAPQFFAWLAAFRPTWYSAVPTMHQAILARASQHRDIIAQCPLRFIRSGSAALPASVHEELERVFKTYVIETYGATEASGLITCNPPPSRPRRAGSVGMPVGSEVAIMDDGGTVLPVGTIGEIVVRGPTVMRGYSNHPRANQHAFIHGWFRTGDQGYLDPDGYLFVTGRLKDIINRGGQKIAPQEVDDVLMDHPAVAQSMTFGVPHAQLGEEIAAAVVLCPHVTATASDLRQFVATRLAAFKVPRQVLIVEEIPQGPTGKLQFLGLMEKLGLMVPDRAQPVHPAGFTAPRTPAEELMAGLWAEVLGVERVGIHDNFFELGGDSLLAMQLLSHICDSMHIEISFFSLFEAPTVAEITELIATTRLAASTVPVSLLQPMPREEVAPAAIAQEHLWAFEQVLPGTPFFNVPFVLRLRGILNMGALEQSINELLHRHEALRTTFAPVNGRLVQVIAPTLRVPLAVTELCALAEPAREFEAHRLARADTRQPFDLARGPLLRVRLLRLGVEEHLLLVTMHHIITDGWSLGVLVDELAALYEAFATGSLSPLAPLPIQYRDFAYWQRQWRHREGMQAQLAYWQQQLRTPLPMLELAPQRPRTTALSFRTACQSLLLPSGLAQSLTRLSRQEGSTLFMTLLAAFKMLLHRYTGQEDLCVGTIVSNRMRPETERLIGLLANTVVLRTHLGGNPSFREVLRRVRATTLAAYAHQDLPFEDLVQDLERECDLRGAALCRVMFVLQPSWKRAALMCRWLAVEDTIAPEVTVTTSDIVIILRANRQGLVGSCIYKTSLFDTAAINRMLCDFQHLLECLALQPEQPLSTYPSLHERFSP